MSLTLTVEIVDDSGLKRAYEGPQLIESATRIIVVRNLTTGSFADASTALSRALDFAEQQFPRKKKYPGAKIAEIVGYEGVGISEDSDSAKVRLIYGNPVVPLVSDSTSTANDTSQFFRNDIDGKLQQLIIRFQDPQNPSIKKDVVVTQTFEKTLRRLVFSGVVPAKDLEPYRAAVNTVNDSKWYGLPIGFWRMTDFDTETNDLGRTFRVQAEFLADIHRDWSKYEVAFDRNTGQPVTIPQAYLDFLVGIKYVNGVLGTGSKNGILKIGNYKLASLGKLFAIPGIPDK